MTLGIACNATVSGELTNDDCRLPLDQSFYDAWTFQGVAGQTVQITMHAAFDTFLFLLDPSGNEVENNDDYPGGGTDSRINYKVDTTGTYTIYANSFDVGVTGAYTLQLTCGGGGPTTCTSDATSLCLNNGRFRVRATFSAPSLGITNAAAQVVPLTADTGYFWFFDAQNVEMIVKVLNACGVNGRIWVFAGGLTNVEVTMTVEDTATGSVQSYRNPQGTAFAPVQDTGAFATCP